MTANPAAGRTGARGATFRARAGCAPARDAPASPRHHCGRRDLRSCVGAVREPIRGDPRGIGRGGLPRNRRKSHREHPAGPTGRDRRSRRLHRMAHRHGRAGCGERLGRARRHPHHPRRRGCGSVESAPRGTPRNGRRGHPTPGRTRRILVDDRHGRRSGPSGEPHPPGRGGDPRRRDHLRRSDFCHHRSARRAGHAGASRCHGTDGCGSGRRPGAADDRRQLTSIGMVVLGYTVRADGTLGAIRRQPHRPSGRVGHISDHACGRGPLRCAPS